MKLDLSFCVACIVLISCNDNKAQHNAVAGQAQQPEVISATEINQPSGDGIIGYWKLALETYDDNSNNILDEAERKKGFKNNYTYRFNADRSCQIQGVYKGRYEEKTESGNKMLYVYRNRIAGEEDKDPAPDVYRIISLGKNELVLLENEGNLTFWVFERVN